MTHPAATALVIIDVQHALFDPDRLPFEGHDVIARINALAVRARAAGVPVVVVQHEADHGPLAHGSDGWALAPALRVEPMDARSRKRTPDAFLDTDLAARLAAHGVGHLVVCGYASEFCIDTTVRSAAARGLAVTLVADAHTTHDKPHASAEAIRRHENATLPQLTSFGVRIEARSTDEVVFDTALAQPAPGA